MKRVLAALLFIGFAGFARADAIDDYINAQMARQHVPGLALAIVRHGQLVRAQGYGFANLEDHASVHPDAMFETGALGMPLTAVATMFLVEDGKLRLDESIRKYLPEAPQSWAPITIRDLLTHTSGLPSTPDGEFRSDYTDEQLLGIIYGQELNFAPGAHWNFSYTDYLVLGMVIKRVSGEFYADLLARRVFAPLGMQTARLMDYRAIVPNRAAGYELTDGRLRNQEWVSPTANSTADGALLLSVLDCARWDAGLLGHELLDRQSWAEIAGPARLASGRTYPYGFGWFLGRSAGQQVRWASGGWQGFQAFMIRYLGDELTVIVLENSDSGEPALIARHVAGMVDPKLALPPAAPIDDREPQVTERLKRLLRQIAAGKAAYRAFEFVSKQEFAERMSDDRATLASLGSLRELALFGRTMLGDDRMYRYRARYDRGLLEINLGYAPDGRIADLDLIATDDWNAPVQW